MYKNVANQKYFSYPYFRKLFYKIFKKTQNINKCKDEFQQKFFVIFVQLTFFKN